jgi:hypothetical protein
MGNNANTLLSSRMIEAVRVIAAFYSSKADNTAIIIFIKFISLTLLCHSPISLYHFLLLSIAI